MTRLSPGYLYKRYSEGMIEKMIEKRETRLTSDGFLIFRRNQIGLSADCLNK